MLKFWHRTAGLIASLFLLLLTATGLLLMQSDDFDLDQRYIDDNRLLDWYGIRPAPPPLSFTYQTHWLTQLGSQLYFDTQALGTIPGAIVGIAPFDDEIIVATTSALVFVTLSGVIAEKLGRESNIPSDIARIGRTNDGRILLEASSSILSFDPASAALTPASTTAAIHWSLPSEPPADTVAEINHQFRGSGLSIERVLLDLHTGRLFGPVGVAVINLASLLLLLLIVSGIALWWLRSRQAAPND